MAGYAPGSTHPLVPVTYPPSCRNRGKKSSPVKSQPRQPENPGKVVIAVTHAGARKIPTVCCEL